MIGQTLKVQACKIFPLADGRFYGGSGEYQDVLAVRDWLNNGGEKPQVDQYFSALVVTPTGACMRLEHALVPMPIQERCHAVGSGRDFALAAMALGKTAAEAVACAAQFDVWTGGVIETLEVTGLGEGEIVWLNQTTSSVR